MSTGKVVLGTLAGLAIGAIAGILFAPEKGSTTRKQILNKGGEYTDELISKFDDLFDALMEKYGAAKKETEKMVSQGNEKYEDAKKYVKNAASDFKHDGAASNKHTSM